MKIEQQFTKKDARELAWIILGQKAKTGSYKVKTALLFVCSAVLFVLTGLLYTLEDKMTGFCWFVLVVGVLALLCGALIFVMLGILYGKMKALAAHGTFTAEVTGDGQLLYRERSAKLKDLRGALCRPYLFLFEDQNGQKTMYVLKLCPENEAAFLRACSRQTAAPIDLCDYGFILSEYTGKGKSNRPRL